MVRVGRRGDRGAVYIGRPTPLGNPFVLKREEDREKVYAQYTEWFNQKIRDEDPDVLMELIKLLNIARKGDLVLGCYCAPRRCHGDAIKQWIDNRLQQEKERGEEFTRWNRLREAVIAMSISRRKAEMSQP